MQSGSDASSLIKEAQALIEQARRSLEGSAGFFRAHAQAAGQAPAQLKQRRDEAQAENLRRFVCEQVNLAQQQPVLPSPEVESDAMTQFARRVRRRRVIV
jgi:hypothetical protein